jgi:hypothetical protein
MPTPMNSAVPFGVDSHLNVITAQSKLDPGGRPLVARMT